MFKCRVLQSATGKIFKMLHESHIHYQKMKKSSGESSECIVNNVEKRSI